MSMRYRTYINKTTKNESLPTIDPSELDCINGGAEDSEHPPVISPGVLTGDQTPIGPGGIRF